MAVITHKGHSLSKFLRRQMYNARLKPGQISGLHGSPFLAHVHVGHLRFIILPNVAVNTIECSIMDLHLQNPSNRSDQITRLNHTVQKHRFKNK